MIGCKYYSSPSEATLGKGRVRPSQSYRTQPARFKGWGSTGSCFCGCPGAFPFCFSFPSLDLHLLTLKFSMAIGQSHSSARPSLWWVENRKGVCHPGCGTSFRDSPLCLSILPTGTEYSYGERFAPHRVLPIAFQTRLSAMYGVVVRLALFPSVKISTKKKKKGIFRPLEGSGLE